MTVRVHVACARCSAMTGSFNSKTPGRSTSNSRTPSGQGSRNARPSSPAASSTTCRVPAAQAASSRSSKYRVRTATNSAAPARGRRAAGRPGRSGGRRHQRTGQPVVEQPVGARAFGRPEVGGPDRRPGDPRESGTALITHVHLSIRPNVRRAIRFAIPGTDSRRPMSGRHASNPEGRCVTVADPLSRIRTSGSAPARRRRASRRPSPSSRSRSGVRSALDDPAPVHHDHLVRTLRSGQSVRDRHRGAATGHRVERALQPHLGRRVDRAGRLVEYQQVRVGHVRPGQRHQLPLAHGQRLAALPHPGRQARRQPGQPVAPARASANAAPISLVGQLRPGEPHVVRDRRVEQEAVLRHHHHPLAQAVEAHRGQRVPAEPHLAARRVHQPGQQLRERGLAAAGLADDRHPASGPGSDRSTVDRTSGPPGYAKLTPSKRTSSGPSGSTTPSGPGRRRPARCRWMSSTRRQPAIAFCTSFMTSVTQLYRLDEQHHEEQERGDPADGQRLPSQCAPPTPSSTPTTTTRGRGQRGGQLAELAAEYRQPLRTEPGRAGWSRWCRRAAGRCGRGCRTRG